MTTATTLSFNEKIEAIEKMLQADISDTILLDLFPMGSEAARRNSETRHQWYELRYAINKAVYPYKRKSKKS